MKQSKESLLYEYFMIVGKYFSFEFKADLKYWFSQESGLGGECKVRKP